MDSTLGLNLICQTHPGKPILGVCLRNACNQKSRLICFKCSTKEHKHGKDILPLNEILNFEDTLKSNNWPFLSQGRKLRGILEVLGHVQSVDSIKNIYDTLLCQINQNLEAVRESSLSVYQQSQEGRPQYIKELREQFQNAYSLNELVRLLNLLSSSQISHEEFQINMEHFLQAEPEEKQIHLEQLAKLLSENRVKQYLQFNQAQFKKLSEQIISAIPRIEKCFRSEQRSQNPFEFEIVPVKDYESITISSDCRDIDMPKKGVVSCSQILDREGTYSVCFRLSQYSQGCIVVGIEMEETRLTSNYWNVRPSFCITCQNLDAIQMSCVKGQLFGDKVRQGASVMMLFNQESNIFQIMDEMGNNVIAMNTSYQLADKPWRMFLYNYSGSPCKFKVENIFWEKSV